MKSVVVKATYSGVQDKRSESCQMPGQSTSPACPLLEEQKGAAMGELARVPVRKLKV